MTTEKQLFYVTLDMQKRGLSTLFKHKIFTILEEERKNWNYDRLDDYLISYKFCISKSLINSFEVESEVRKVLNTMLEDECFFTITKNN